MDYYSPFSAPGVISTIDEPRVRLAVGHQQSPFWLILDRFVDYYSPFWGPRATTMVAEPKVHLRVVQYHSPFWPILTRFMGYYSPFWGPEAIFMVAEAQGAATCHSSTLTILAIFGPFNGLLLTVLGS